MTRELAACVLPPRATRDAANRSHAPGYAPCPTLSQAPGSQFHVSLLLATKAEVVANPGRKQQYQDMGWAEDTGAVAAGAAALVAALGLGLTLKLARDARGDAKRALASEKEHGEALARQEREHAERLFQLRVSYSSLTSLLTLTIQVRDYLAQLAAPGVKARPWDESILLSDKDYGAMRGELRAARAPDVEEKLKDFKRSLDDFTERRNQRNRWGVTIGVLNPAGQMPALESSEEIAREPSQEEKNEKKKDRESFDTLEKQCHAFARQVRNRADELDAAVLKALHVQGPTGEDLAASAP